MHAKHLLVICFVLLVATNGFAALPRATPAQAQALRISIREPAQKTVAQFGKIELTLETNLLVANPFDPNQADVRAHFFLPTHTQTTVPAFYDGQTWRVRFTPTQAGAWRVRAEVNSAGNVARSPSIQLTVQPDPGKRGFVRVHTHNPRYLAFDNGKTFVPIGANTGWWLNNNDPLKDYARWFAALQTNGANTARIWMSSWAFGIEWQNTGLGNYTQRMNRAEYLDAVLRLAEAHGIYLIITLINHGAFSTTTNSEWAFNPYLNTNGGPCKTPRDFATDPTARAFFKQRLRYIMARWAYSPNILAWEWWNEVEFTPIDTAVLKPWIEEMTRVVREHDVNRHLLTTSYAGDGDPTIWKMPEIDLLMRHEYNNGEPKWFGYAKNINALQRIPANLQKPFLVGEFGASANGEFDTPAGRLGIHLHNSAWASVMNGFAGSALYWYWDIYIEPTNTWTRYKGLSTFIQNEDLAAYVPITTTTNTPFATALGLGRDGSALVWLRNKAYSDYAAKVGYAISQSTGEPFAFAVKPLRQLTLTLPMRNGTYAVQWFNTRTGLATQTTTATAISNTLHIFVPVLEEDAAMKVSSRP